MAHKKRTSFSKPLPELEKSIGLRLNYARRRNKLEQAEFSKSIGMTISKLANIESGRTFLRLGVALKACKQLDIHPGWLFSGHSERMFPRLDPNLFARIDREVFQQHGERLFSEAMPQYLWMLNEDSQAQVETREALDRWDKARTANSAPIMLEIKVENNMLTHSATSLKEKPVRDQLPGLLERLRKVAERRGAMSALAKTLGVPLASVSRWLSGEREPGGEITLKLLHWVEEQEDK
jgi:transcriptional regulator with XRE-family HTH domain